MILCRSRQCAIRTNRDDLEVFILYCIACSLRVCRGFASYIKSSSAGFKQQLYMPAPSKAPSAYLRPITSASRQRPPRNHFQPRPLRTVDRSEVAVGAATGVFFNGTLLVCCGAVDGAPSSTVRFLPLFGDGETGWTAVECGLAQGVSTAPAPRMYAISALFRGRLIMMGGDAGTGAAIQDCWALNMSADARIWTPITLNGAALIPTRCAFAQLSDGVILAQGGLDRSGAATAEDRKSVV